MDKATTTPKYIDLPLTIYSQGDGQSNVEVVYWALDRLKREHIFNAKDSDSVRNDDFKYSFYMIDRVQSIQDDLVSVLFERLAEQV